MPEGPNPEIAHEPAGKGEQRVRRREEIVEILEAILLALVAVTTAWSGYQAARWDGHQAFLYGESSRLRVQAGVAATEGGQERLLDVTTFNTWIQATFAGEDALAAFYVRRFSPEYKVAFDAWLLTDPLHNPATAPPGPISMPDYHNALLEKSDRLNAAASAAFAAGTHARETAESYVRVTVLMAMVLFLIAISQRFKLRNVRVAVSVVAGVVLVVSLVDVASLPRL
jgi:hypothetical protein